MSYLSDYAENKLVDMLRAQAWALPASLYLGLASAVADGAVTELAGSGYARVPVTRSLANWAGTQGAGTTLASVGASHATSNNITIDWGTSGSAWGTASHVVIYDAVSGGNLVCYVPMITPQVIGDGVPVSLAPGLINLTLGLAGGCSDYLSNKLIDFIFRGQAYSFPATAYFALYTSLPSNAGGGVEVVGAGSGYARIPTSLTLASWAGTQGAATTTVSTGTSGETSNNNVHAFAAPTKLWGVIIGSGIFDASTAGNLLFWAVHSPKTVVAGASPPSFPSAGYKIRFA